ncbi:MAG: heavy-metal-associated domain-containing protein [Gammaproteobacteria bacterium]|nr:heavy-metal-associated domain-containing protein [Gammaproteobacteria bacterium]MDE0052685.1 heavy-metal-associated domain-containing protein [Gammaproteobacteria bacterium]MDE0226735.1 heavy-metal-associated domain-containing protein [Gammaproteobacteria bacterium]MDE0452204.1 heavy-metal-associated domain-containing protein [Gammaproteobacteria bacterium]
MEHLQIKIEGMECDGCVTSVQRALMNRPGVGAARADLDSGMVAIDFDSSRIDRPGLEAAIQDAGFDIAAG